MYPEVLIISGLFNRESILRGLFGRYGKNPPVEFILVHEPWDNQFVDNEGHGKTSCWWNSYDSVEFISNNGLKLGACRSSVINPKVCSKICPFSMEKLKQELQLFNQSK